MGHWAGTCPLQLAHVYTNFVNCHLPISSGQWQHHTFSTCCCIPSTSLFPFIMGHLYRNVCDFSLISWTRTVTHAVSLLDQNPVDITAMRRGPDPNRPSYSNRKGGYDVRGFVRGLVDRPWHRPSRCCFCSPVFVASFVCNDVDITLYNSEAIIHTTLFASKGSNT